MAWNASTEASMLMQVIDEKNALYRDIAKLKTCIEQLEKIEKLVKDFHDEWVKTDHAMTQHIVAWNFDNKLVQNGLVKKRKT